MSPGEEDTRRAAGAAEPDRRNRSTWSNTSWRVNRQRRTRLGTAAGTTLIQPRTAQIDADQLPPLTGSIELPHVGTETMDYINRSGLNSFLAYLICDVVVPFVLIAFTLPIMVIVALAIRCDSPGRVFYRQERVGLSGRRFNLLKFRSMIQDAEPEGRPVWAAEKDNRVTRVGRFIRRMRIDELPQLFNVLRGEMSMVGPRPERPYFVDQLTEIIPFFAERHSVKPGVTGWAQIKYPYGASIEDARKKLTYDLYYLKKRSITLDLLILLSTVRVVILQQGAR